MDYPELAARTRRFSLGAPRAITVASDGSRVVFLRSSGPDDPVDGLVVFDVESGTQRVVADPARLRPAGPGADPARLPAAEQALRERLRLSASGIGSYATDRNATMAAFTLGGRLYRADLIGGSVTEVECAGTAAGSVVDPRPDPGGRRIAYVSAGKLRVATVEPANPAGSSDALIAGEEGIDWGLAEFIAAEEFGRYRGYWWAPDGGSLLAARVDESRVPRWTMHDPALPDAVPRSVAYPYAGAANAQVSLHLLDLEGGWVDVHWDRETYPYLAVVSWLDGGGPLIGVLRRLQQHGLVLAVDARTGETQVHAELADPRWVDGIPGTPMYLPDGRVLVGGELAHDGYDARCLFADGTLLTPPGLYVRRVCGRVSAAGAGGEAAPGGTDLLVEASEGEPSEQYLYRVTAHPGAPVVDATRVQLAGVGSAPGWHVGFGGGETIVVGSQSLDHPGVRWSVHRAGGQYAGELTNLAATPPYAPRPLLQRVTDRRLPTGVLYPRSHVAGRKLPVLVDVYGGPSHQEVVATRARWLARQWWADAGFAVVVVDNRGTSGVSPSFEKVIHRRMADVALTDQVEALRALAEKHVDLDLDRVAIRGWSYGGWLAGLAALRRPDTYHAAVLGAPVTDWRLYDTAYTERYLGLPGDGSDVYEHHSLIALAEQPPARPQDARPMLLIHGLADDNVVSAHTLRLSAALLFAGRPHAVLPLTGASHMAAGVSEPLLRLELDFVRRALG